MTNEEAIKLIDDRMCFGRGKWSEHHKPEIDIYWQAGEMAIKALEAEPHWIPCSERLPERGKDVLVTRDYDGREDCNKSCRYVEIASRYGEDDDPDWTSFSDEYKMHPKNHHVIAWRELPEPYKEVTE